MSFVRAVIVLGLVLGLEAGLGRVWPTVHRYVDLLALPPLWYGLRRSQLSAMTVGCAAGLLQDAWFRAGVYGLNGFKKTLLGWALGAIGGRFDLNTGAGRFAAGALFTVADGLLDLLLRSLLDLQLPPRGALDLLLRGMSTGLLALWVFPLIEQVGARAAAGRSF